ncbi:MAG: alpha/beta hydrolase [Oscillospiraceae bacterium]|nr:alpha/beta hydrolase [Oscillospiraceae bacterium]
MSIIKTTAYYNSSTGKDKIFARTWRGGETQPKAVIQLAHGACEHSGRYDGFAKFLAGNGFVVCANDHLGHGKSAASISAMGYTAENGGYIRMTDDMHILSNIMRKKYPGLPYFLFGHSMGSFLARLYMANFGDELSGAVICGTNYIPKSVQPAQGIVWQLFKTFDSDKFAAAVSEGGQRLMSLLAGGGFNKLDWVSKSEENRLNYTSDPLITENFKPSGLRDLLVLAVEASKPGTIAKTPSDLPILMISGAKDPVGFSGKSVIALADAFEAVGIEPTVIIYPGDRHEILNEADNDKIYNDILKWLDAVLKCTA